MSGGSAERARSAEREPTASAHAVSVDPTVPEHPGNPQVPRFQVVPAAYVLLRRPVPGDVEVLLQLRQGTGYMDGHWAFGAAGHVEAGEDVLAAAVREVHEELGVVVDRDALVPLTAMHRTHANGRAIDERVDFFFAADRWAGTAHAVEDKAAALRWVRLGALDDLAEPVVPHERYVLDRLRRGDLPSVTTFGFAAPG
ncbi:NUDIX domain-containing protein [Georgenia faecalis]|uniref:NUDIX domain-containing protein n=1 Tax=Georgenia faecalis TaxID=2483799 RepID=UPI0030BA20EA